MLRHVWMPVLAATLAAGCGSQGTADRTASGNFVPPVTRAPEPLPGQEHTRNLSAYIGRYPRDAVEGVAFFDRTEVGNVLIDLVPEEDQRRRITARDAVSVPIFRMGSRVAAHGCEAHNCADRNWTVVIPADGYRENAAVCFHDVATMGRFSRWSTRAGSEQRPEACPQA